MQLSQTVIEIGLDLSIFILVFRHLTIGKSQTPNDEKETHSHIASL